MTNREKIFLSVSALLALIIAVLAYFYVEIRRDYVSVESKLPALQSGGGDESAKFAAEFARRGFVAADFKTDQIIVAFRRNAAPADRVRVENKLGAIASEVLKKATEGAHLTSGDPDEIGAIQLITLKPQPPPQVRQHGNQLNFAPSVTSKTVMGEAFRQINIISQIEQLRSDKAVLFAQPNYVYHLTDTPDDEFYQSGQLWNMYSSNSAIANQFGSQAAQAWANGHTGSRTVYVAVIDSGIDATHPDLAQNVDTHDAVDYARNSQDPTDAPYVNKDEIGHGTHVAGVIGAIGNNKVGVAGVNWQIQLVPVKVVSTAGTEEIDDPTAIKAFQYITQLKNKGLNIAAANVSWSGPGLLDKNGEYVEDYYLLSAVKAAARSGILCIASAGNDSNDNDQTSVYPAVFDTRDAKDGTDALTYNAVISVAAIDAFGNLWPRSNYGANSVLLGAPGVGILSTLPASSQLTTSAALRSADGSSYYGVETGTSASAPHVTGAVALYIADHPGVAPQDVVNMLMHSVRNTGSLAGKTATGGRLDVSTF